MITTFGEIMLRISPKYNGERIFQTNDFEIRTGGSESNVAVALANLGAESSFITLLPDNPLGQKILRQLRSESVDTRFIKPSSERIGVYWTENGTGPRNSYVLYDRENSAFCNATYQDFDWEEILRQTKWFHFSGISPAIHKNIADLLENVISTITCPYSVDLNFRSTLWKWTNGNSLKIKQVMTSLCNKATLLAGNESDFQNIFGFKQEADNETEEYISISKKCFDSFPLLKHIAISNRVSHSATSNSWSAYLFVRNDKKYYYKSKEYNLDCIQDRVGTGDSFVAGILYGLSKVEQMNWQEIIDFAACLGALNHTIKGDASNFSVDEVNKTLKSEGSGRIER